MNDLDIDDVVRYVEENIGVFHTKRIESLGKLKLAKILKRKNIYLFKAKNTQTASQIVNGIVDAYSSSREETLFGNWLEGLAIYINQLVYDGVKSGIEGIDLEFSDNDRRHIVTIKSGPHWGNSSSVKKMKTDFIRAAKTIRTSGSGVSVVPINGCCYGIDNNPDKGDYQKLCGQRFWKFISNRDDLYEEIIQPLGHLAHEKNSEFDHSYSKMVNKFTKEFTNTYCLDNGEIDWKKLIELNSKSK
ncbi:MAG: hypothetical protein JKY43_10715 [Phycisphaerales bacterium]|nr:hypothetical protein [Phycisphaerales bacterium]